MTRKLAVREPKRKEAKELQRIADEAPGKIAIRAHSVLLATEQDRKVNELSTIFRVNPQTMSRWLHNYNEKGPQGLYDLKRGRPRKYAAAT